MKKNSVIRLSKEELAQLKGGEGDSNINLPKGSEDVVLLVRNANRAAECICDNKPNMGGNINTHFGCKCYCTPT